jgi:hypothetical protein
MAAILASKPMWLGVGTASNLLQLPEMTVLHAGPPLKDPCKPPLPITNSTVLTCIYEGWAKNELDAANLIHAGKIRFIPSLNYRAVLPLAAVISSSSPLTVIQAEGDSKKLWFSLLGSGIGPQNLFGTNDLAVLERMSFRDQVLVPGFQLLLENGPIDLLSIARAALNEGDDLHNRLSTATQILHSIFLTRKIKAKPALVTLNTLLESPGFFLHQWMPACAAILDSANGIIGSSIVTNISGNGVESAIQISGLSGRWFTFKAFAIKGPAIKNTAPIEHFPPHIGDSGIIDALGLGGQVLHRASTVQTAFLPWLPSNNDLRANSILMNHHLGIDSVIGTDARIVAQTGHTPLISTAMVATDGSGLLGRGIGLMPIEPFKKAIIALDASVCKFPNNRYLK